MFLDQFEDVYLEFYNQLGSRTAECDELITQVSSLKKSSEKIYLNWNILD